MSYIFNFIHALVVLINYARARRALSAIMCGSRRSCTRWEIPPSKENSKEIYTLKIIIYFKGFKLMKMIIILLTTFEIFPLSLLCFQLRFKQDHFLYTCLKYLRLVITKLSFLLLCNVLGVSSNGLCYDSFGREVQ